MAIEFVTSQNAGGTAVSQVTLSTTPALGDTLIIGVFMQNGQAAVSQISDNMGFDLFDNPLNNYVNLGAINLNGTRVELWGVCPLKAVPNYSIEDLEITINLTGVQSVVSVVMLEYSGVSSFGQYGTTSNSGYSDLFFQGTAQNNTNIMVAFFGDPSGSGVSGSGTYNIPGIANFVITPAVQRANVSGAGGQLLALEQSTINNPQLLIAQIVTQGVAPLGLMAVGVTLNGGFALQTPPGFSDIDPTQLTAGTTLHALKINQIAQNAALGMVRPEFFYGTYRNGDTVIAPISPTDGYNYSRDELIYVYTPYTTFDSDTGWTSAAGILFYCQWEVDPITGEVTIQEFYHPDGNQPTNQTNDGQLIVLTIGQRGMSGSTISAASGISMSIPPSLFEIQMSLFAEDKPTTQTMLRALAENSKFSAIKAEVFYMGEFVDGQQVQTPISYADGYKYSLDECKFISSWKWTTAPDNYGPPPMYTASGGNADGGWSQLNEMTAAVDADGNVTCNVTFFNNSVIDPTDPANGGLAYGRLQVYCFCQRNKGPYFGLPIMTTGAGGTGTFTMEIPGPQILGSVTGDLVLTLQGDMQSGGSPPPTVITKMVIKRTLAGSTTVIDTTDFTFSSSAGVTIAPMGSASTDVLANWTFDNAHDYYIMAVLSGGFGAVNTQGLVNTTTPLLYTALTGDQSGVTTIPTLTQETAVWWLWQAIKLTIVGDTVGNGFAELPLTDEVAVFVPGNKLPVSYMSQLAQNVKESAYAIEFFGPFNHVNSDTVSLPTSPTDGYEYSREEVVYIWQWHDTGSPKPRLFGWGASISSAGVVNMMCWHVPPGGPVQNITTGASLDVLVIACRQQTTAALTNPLGNNNGNPPSDNGSGTFGGAGGFTINGGS